MLMYQCYKSRGYYVNIRFFFLLSPSSRWRKCADVGLQTAVNHKEEETCFDFAHQRKDLFKVIKGSVLKILFYDVIV